MISINLKTRITEFKVDMKREWTPYTMSKRGKRGVSTSLEDARQGCNDIYEILTRKQLSVNDTKCKYMVIGSKKQRNQALKDLEKDPMR